MWQGKCIVWYFRGSEFCGRIPPQNSHEFLGTTKQQQRLKTRYRGEKRTSDKTQTFSEIEFYRFFFTFVVLNPRCGYKITTNQRRVNQHFQFTVFTNRSSWLLLVSWSSPLLLGLTALDGLCCIVGWQFWFWVFRNFFWMCSKNLKFRQKRIFHKDHPITHSVLTNQLRGFRFQNEHSVERNTNVFYVIHRIPGRKERVWTEQRRKPS